MSSAWSCGEHEVDRKDVVERAGTHDRLSREQVDDPAVHVQVPVDPDGLDEPRQRDRDSHQPADRQVGRQRGAEVVDRTAIHVVHDRGEWISKSPAVSDPNLSVNVCSIASPLAIPVNPRSADNA